MDGVIEQYLEKNTDSFIFVYFQKKVIKGYLKTVEKKPLKTESVELQIEENMGNKIGCPRGGYQK